MMHSKQIFNKHNMSSFNKTIAFTIAFLMISLLSTNLSFSEQEYVQDTYNFITQENINTIVSTNSEKVTFQFELENTQNSPQKFNLSVNPSSQWSVELENSVIELEANEKRLIEFDVTLPNNLGYNRIVDSQGLSKYVLDDEYFGIFNFPIFINPQESDDTLEVVYRLEVYAPTRLPVDFTLEPSSLLVSPQYPLDVIIEGDNLDEEAQESVEVEIEASIGDIELNSQTQLFSYQRNTAIASFSIPPQIEPGVYNSVIRVKLDRDEGRSQSWELQEEIRVDEYEKLEVTEKSSYSVWSYDTTISISNEGNIESVYEYSESFSWYERLFLASNVDYNIINSEHVFSQTIEPGNEEIIRVSIRYGVILIILVIVVIIYGIRTYLYYKNPLDVEVKFESIKKVKHEGIKSFKVKIGFENIRKEEIDTLKVTFKMPSYLHVRDESFSITPPTKVLKGSKTYKLMWEFKRFEKGDARILGFELVNSKGILGDIHFEDLEMEVISNGKKSVYKTPLEIIRG